MEIIDKVVDVAKGLMSLLGVTLGIAIFSELIFGKFLGDEGGRIPPGVVRKNWRKNLHRLYRWARRSDPACLPALALSAARAILTLPAPDDYFRYAARIHRTLGSDREDRP